MSAAASSGVASSTSSSSPPLALPYEDCPICLCPLADSKLLYTTDCGHVFDAECLTKYLADSLECPLDRRPIKSCKHIASPASGVTSSDSSKDLILVKVKYNKLLFDLLVSKSSSFSSFKEQCGKAFSLDPSKLKLIYANRVLSEEASRSSAGGQWSGFKQVLHSATVPMIQLIASQTAPTEGKWKQEDEGSSCSIQ